MNENHNIASRHRVTQEIINTNLQMPKKRHVWATKIQMVPENLGNAGFLEEEEQQEQINEHDVDDAEPERFLKSSQMTQDMSPVALELDEGNQENGHHHSHHHHHHSHHHHQEKQNPRKEVMKNIQNNKNQR